MPPRYDDEGDLFSGAACPACHGQRDHTRQELLDHHPLASRDCNREIVRLDRLALLLDQPTDEELDTIGKRLAERLHESHAATRAKLNDERK